MLYLASFCTSRRKKKNKKKKNKKKTNKQKTVGNILSQTQRDQNFWLTKQLFEVKGVEI